MLVQTNKSILGSLNFLMINILNIIVFFKKTTKAFEFKQLKLIGCFSLSAIILGKVLCNNITGSQLATMIQCLEAIKCGVRHEVNVFRQ